MSSIVLHGIRIAVLDRCRVHGHAEVEDEARDPAAAQDHVHTVDPGDGGVDVLGEEDILGRPGLHAELGRGDLER